MRGNIFCICMTDVIIRNNPLAGCHICGGILLVTFQTDSDHFAAISIAYREGWMPKSYSL
jgi:hypothetical protein